MRTLLHSLSLALASAVTAEFLLGDQYLSGMAAAPQQFAELLLFIAFYGSAAVLIRETARRARLGWPGILTLALAFGVLEEGVVTQSLFNPDYAGLHLIADGFVPWLGTGGPWLIYVLTLHVVWSIGSPLAVLEGAYGDRPWMRHAGWLAVPAVFLVLGGAAIAFTSVVESHFVAAPTPLIACVAIAAVLATVAFVLLRRGPGTHAPQRGLGYLGSLVSAFVLTSLFQLARELPVPSPWLTSGALVVMIVAGIALAVVRRLDPLGLGSGAILTYCWVGMLSAARVGAPALLEQLVIVVIALGVLSLVAWRRTGRHDTTRGSRAVA